MLYVRGSMYSTYFDMIDVRLYACVNSSVPNSTVCASPEDATDYFKGVRILSLNLTALLSLYWMYSWLTLTLTSMTTKLLWSNSLMIQFISQFNINSWKWLRLIWDRVSLTLLTNTFLSEELHRKHSLLWSERKMWFGILMLSLRKAWCLVSSGLTHIKTLTLELYIALWTYLETWVESRLY
jgi:hypothetical protein